MSVRRGKAGLLLLLLRALDGHANFLAGLLDILQNLTSTRSGRLVAAFELFVLTLEVFNFGVEVVN